VEEEVPTPLVVSAVWEVLEVLEAWVRLHQYSVPVCPLLQVDQVVKYAT
jgi:hypothetical protein